MMPAPPLKRATAPGAAVSVTLLTETPAPSRHSSSWAASLTGESTKPVAAAGVTACGRSTALPGERSGAAPADAARAARAATATDREASGRAARCVAMVMSTFPSVLGGGRRPRPRRPGLAAGLAQHAFDLRRSRSRRRPGRGRTPRGRCRAPRPAQQLRVGDDRRRLVGVASRRMVSTSCLPSASTWRPGWSVRRPGWRSARPPGARAPATRRRLPFASRRWECA